MCVCVFLNPCFSCHQQRKRALSRVCTSSPLEEEEGGEDGEEGLFSLYAIGVCLVKTKSKDNPTNQRALSQSFTDLCWIKKEKEKEKEKKISPIHTTLK